MSAARRPKSSPARATKGRARAAFDAEAHRRDFPALHQNVHGKPLVYLDNAATTQKPQAVIDAERHYYEADNANIHRGVHLLSERATAKYEKARDTVRRFVGASAVQETIFVRGTTEAINLVAQSFVRPRLRKGDEVLVTGLEHHSNIVPWQLVCEATGAKLRVAAINDAGEVPLDDFRRLLTKRTRFASFAHVSNALGTVNPVAEMTKAAHDAGVPVLVDGAQAVPHMPVDVGRLGCDFYAFSGHKVYGPTGVGVLYGKREHLDAMPPYQGGGDMIRSVSFEETTYNDLPYKFEAGTPNIAGGIGLGAALEYVSNAGLEAVAAHEARLLRQATDELSAMKGLRIIGTARHKAGVVSFHMEGIHPHDVGTLLDRDGIAVRTGHHCAQPVMDRYGLPATSRASFALYNTAADVEALAAGLRKVRKIFGGAR